MERHVGTWYKENDPSKSKVGELLIEGNHLEFYSRFHGLVFPETLIGEDGKFKYKVFVNGYAKPGQNRTLDNTSSHNVFFVLMQNFDFSKGTDISGVKEFSFAIPELVEWLGIQTVFYTFTDQEQPAAGEKHLDSIIIHETNPKIELYFESKTLESRLSFERNIAITVKKEPRIRVTYTQPADIQKICDEIECIMQFFGLLIGKVSTADDIRLCIESQLPKSWLYINHDYSYNLMTRDILARPNTYCYMLQDNLAQYYCNWRKFCFDDEQYTLLRKRYFSVNDTKERFLEDIFVEYMKILDGYHTRISGDSAIAEQLSKAVKGVASYIKQQIFTEENRQIFENDFQGVLPDWSYNSRNINDISHWIASGYLGKKALSYRLKELDTKYNYHFGIIKNNAVAIENLAKINSTCDSNEDVKIIEQFYRRLSNTRNYFSHYKKEKTGILTPTQMNISILILKATIISIFLYHTGIDKELVRKMLAFDKDFLFITQFLQKAEEQPFLHPQEWLKAYENNNTSQTNCNESTGNDDKG